MLDKTRCITFSSFLVRSASETLQQIRESDSIDFTLVEIIGILLTEYLSYFGCSWKTNRDLTIPERRRENWGEHSVGVGVSRQNLTLRLHFDNVQPPSRCLPSRQYFGSRSSRAATALHVSKKNVTFCFIEVSTFICKREISGLSPPLKCTWNEN